MPEPDEVQPEPDEVRYACIGCGTMNPAGAESCAGCGHRFAGPDVVSTHRADAESVAPRSIPAAPIDPYASINPYAPPRASLMPSTPRFRIGSAMAMIAVIAVCLGAFASSTALGIAVTLGLVPATFRTFQVSGRRQAMGRPMRPEEKVLTFVYAVGATILVSVSSLIAFCITCFPVGLVAGSGNWFPVGIVLAFGIGILAALATAVGIVRALLRGSRERELLEIDRESIRWR